MKLRAITAALALACSGGVHAATTLTGHATADNAFLAYVSTSDAVLGTLIGSGDNWGLTYGFSTTLSANVDYYLHIVAKDAGRPEAFIGDFVLSSTDYSFSNGAQTLSTGLTHWKATDGIWGGWSAPTGTPVDRGVNGSGPWGPRINIAATTHWIWSANYGTGTTYFSTKIVSNVPEPETYAMMLAGLGLLGAAARRKRTAA